SGRAPAGRSRAAAAGPRGHLGAYRLATPPVAAALGCSPAPLPSGPAIRLFDRLAAWGSVRRSLVTLPSPTTTRAAVQFSRSGDADPGQNRRRRYPSGRLPPGKGMRSQDPGPRGLDGPWSFRDDPVSPGSAAGGSGQCNLVSTGSDTMFRFNRLL